MAIIKNGLKMAGSIQGVSYFTRVGSDKVIARSKGGPTARRMKVGDEFKNTRKHQMEWKACVKFSKGLHHALGETYRLGDYSLCATWNGMGKNIMGLDTSRPVGERNLLISQHRQVLEDFSLNRTYPFNTVLRVSTEFEIDKATLHATVSLPHINTAMVLLNIQKLPYFRVIVNLGIISDFLFIPDNVRYPYQPVLQEYNGCSKSVVTAWFSTNDIIDPQSLTVQLEPRLVELMTPDTTALLSIGVEFGSVGFGGQINPVKRAGCGKILASV
ncbi:MAG: hypothetical protein PHT07_11045 [Paludibacter sp.]|nr:hypothetical protein [Paludibacter sp.]